MSSFAPAWRSAIAASRRTHDEKAPVKRPGLVYFAVDSTSEKQAPISLRVGSDVDGPIQTISCSQVVRGRRRKSLSIIHGDRHEAIGGALFGDIPDAREGEVIADERELILGRHIEYSLSRL